MLLKLTFFLFLLHFLYCYCFQICWPSWSLCICVWWLSNGRGKYIWNSNKEILNKKRYVCSVFQWSLDSKGKVENMLKQDVKSSTYIDKTLIFPLKHLYVLSFFSFASFMVFCRWNFTIFMPCNGALRHKHYMVFLTPLGNLWQSWNLKPASHSVDH